MKKSFFLLFLLFSAAAFAQEEGQSFCDGLPQKGYFTFLSMDKFATWESAYYMEAFDGEQQWNGKTYRRYIQLWNMGSRDTLYLREEGTKILQYNEATGKDIVRFDSSFKVGHKWKGKDVRYKLLSFDAELETPLCQYKNLLAIEAVYPQSTYVFYYLRGFGYVGATEKGKLHSYVFPKVDIGD